MTDFTSEDAGTDRNIPPVRTSIERGHEVDRRDQELEASGAEVSHTVALGVAHCKARSTDEFPVDTVALDTTVDEDEVMDQTVEEGFDVKEAR